MKNKLNTLLMVVAIAALVSAGAIAGEATAVRANVPFDFVVVGAHVPAGEYVFTRGGLSNTMTIRSADLSTALTVVFSNAGDNKLSAPSALVFYNYAGRRFLREVWGGGNQIAARFGKSRAEKEPLTRAPIKTTVAAALVR